MYGSLETLLLKVANEEGMTWHRSTAAMSIVNSLVAQLSTFYVLMRVVPIRCFKDILTRLKGLQPNERQFIDNVIVVCKLIHFNPATSATKER